VLRGDNVLNSAMRTHEPLREAIRTADMRFAVPVACRLLGVTQAAVARDIGISAPRLSNFIHGRRDLPSSVVELLRRRLELPPAAVAPADTC
jgi:DNA-binding transcriptional regulator YdaS (Cro superfamily)